jgi:hypothetical protein
MGAIAAGVIKQEEYSRERTYTSMGLAPVSIATVARKLPFARVRPGHSVVVHLVDYFAGRTIERQPADRHRRGCAGDPDVWTVDELVAPSGDQRAGLTSKRSKTRPAVARRAARPQEAGSKLQDDHPPRRRGGPCSATTSAAASAAGDGRSPGGQTRSHTARRA